MNLRNKITTVAAAIAMVAVPTIASAAPAAKALSVRAAAPVRAASVQRDESKLGGSILIAVLAAAAVVEAIVTKRLVGKQFACMASRTFLFKQGQSFFFGRREGVGCAA